MTNKTLNLSESIYFDFAGKDGATPRDVLETVLYQDSRLGREWTDIDLSTKDYINRIRKAFAPLGGTLSDNGMTLTYPDPATVDIYALIYRAKHIDTKTILASHLDDGYVITPCGRVWTGRWWDTLTSMMDTRIASALSDQMAPCTCQAFADAYAAKHQEEYGEEWEPYKDNPQI